MILLLTVIGCGVTWMVLRRATWARTGGTAFLHTMALLLLSVVVIAILIQAIIWGE